VEQIKGKTKKQNNMLNAFTHVPSGSFLEDTNNNKEATAGIPASLQKLLSLSDVNQAPYFTSERQQKISFKMMRKTLLIQLMLIFFISPSFSQLRMKNRSAWRKSAETAVPSSEKKNNSTPLSSEKAAGGEADTASAKHLDEVVVTATRTEKKLEDIGRSVSLISKEDIQNSGANTVAELLSQYEGIYITGTQQTFGANQSMFIRGANSNQSVIMVDGVPVTDPSTPNNAVDLSEFSLSDIDRIEIVRGSHSTLYGSSAIGGVVNIITSGKQKQGLSINTAGTAGAFGQGTSLVSENIGMNYTDKLGFYAGLNLYNMNVDGLDATVDTAHVPGVVRDKDGMNRFDYGGKVGYKTDRWDVHLGYNMINTHADIDKKEFTDDPKNTLDFTRSLISFGATCKVDSIFTISWNGAVSSMTRTNVDDSSAANLHSYSKEVDNGQTATNELQLMFKKKGYNLIFGVGANDQMMSQQFNSYSPGFVYSSNLDSLNLASRTNSVFMLADMNGEIFSEKAKAFSISIGGRMNKNNTFGSSSTYQINPMVKISETSSLYANFSSGYNAPSLYQLHSPSQDMTSHITTGNINLRPEQSATKEFGVYQKLSEHSWIRIGYFKTVVNDIIEWVYLWDKNTAIDSLNYTSYRGDTYLNLGKLTTEGVEMSVHSALSKKLLLSANFSYARGWQDYSAANIDSAKTHSNHVQLFSNGKFLTDDFRADGLTRRPVMANITLTYYPAKKVFCKAIVKYVAKRNDFYLQPDFTLGRIPVDAYTLVDFAGGVKFDANTSALVRVENVLDLSYSEIRGYTSRGRGIYLTVNYTF